MCAPLGHGLGLGRSRREGLADKGRVYLDTLVAINLLQSLRHRFGSVRVRHDQGLLMSQFVDFFHGREDVDQRRMRGHKDSGW